MTYDLASFTGSRRMSDYSPMEGVRSAAQFGYDIRNIGNERTSASAFTNML
ncbi:hypothetical protein [Pseudomonas syringae]|uniref:hypothetical protein n=1 Tax=Pseudomonas syringae TaxID=317 RepID=UPI0004080883|nr:hypothetical protein [Pseudomonas syringae]UZS65013.1 hypothetical protein OQB64_13055 [Pseudomonas syringae]